MDFGASNAATVTLITDPASWTASSKNEETAGSSCGSALKQANTSERLTGKSPMRIKKAQHNHSFFALAIYDLSAGLVGSYGGAPPKTIVLQNCECGELRTITLEGRWTLAQVRGHADLDATEEIELSLLH